MATAKSEEKLIALFFDAQTGESVEREFNADEIAEHNANIAADLAAKAEAEAKAAARESALAKLADLGLTAEEIAAL